MKPPFGVPTAAAEAPYGDRTRLITLPGGLTLDFALLNYAKYIKEVSAARSLPKFFTELCRSSEICIPLPQRINCGRGACASFKVHDIKLIQQLMSFTVFRHI